MKNTWLTSISRRVRSKAAEESGQALIMVTMSLVVMLGFAGLVIDAGRSFISYRQLQSSTDAAALAGANDLPNSTAVATATSYSGVSGGANSYTNLTGVTMSPNFPLVQCLGSTGIPCQAPANGNAIFVKQQVTIPLYFGALFGTPTLTLKAAAAASMHGSIAAPYNVAIIMDTTASMNSNDTACGNTQLICALAGFRILLQNMAPCASQATTCSVTSGVATNSVDRVAIVTFPNVTVGTTQNEYKCTTSNPTVVPYTYPVVPTVSAATPPALTSAIYEPSGSTTSTYVSGSATPTYWVTPFWSDYKTSDSTSTLNTASYLVQAAGGGSCGGMLAKGGAGTYYAGAIYAAQSILLEEQAVNTTAGAPAGTNVIIILSDGDATACFYGTAHNSTGGNVTVPQGSCSTNDMSAHDTSSGLYINNYGTYPSYVSECTQAVTAAATATAQGTRVYTIAYGSTTTSGCATEVSGSIYLNNTCMAMQKMASATKYFYSTSQTVSGVTTTSCPNAVATTNLNQVFTDISSDFTHARLIPITTT